MDRSAIDPSSTRLNQGLTKAWLARRWYYTSRSHRAYSVRQISPGDRRLLAEFSLSLAAAAGDNDLPGLRSLHNILFDRVIATDGSESSMGFAALENTSGGDRVVGIAAYAAVEPESADFVVAVDSAFREEQVGSTLMSTLLRHAKRVGVPRLAAEMVWSNRPMHLLAVSMGFAIEPLPHDRNLRQLILSLK